MSWLGALGIGFVLVAAVGWAWLLREAIRDLQRKRREMDAAFDRIFAEIDAIDRRTAQDEP